jgi:hypothetical protein
MSWGIFVEELALVTWMGVRDRVLRAGRRRQRVEPEAA